MRIGRLPPLKALRAFEAAARHLSFSKAAEELFVTPGAISQQIKLLEEFLGVSLFKRMHRRILLTDSAQCILPGIQSGLNQMSNALDELKSINFERPITITTPPSFATKWLVPRLKSFRKSNPEIDIRIDTSIEVVDLTHSDIDIAIRFGNGEYTDMQVDFMLHQEVFPVCSPKLVSKKRPLKHPSDLKNFEILQYDPHLWESDWPDWQMWLMAVGAEDVDMHRGLSFSQQELLVQAAIDGQGVALVGSVSVEDDLKAGKLIKPFEQSYPLKLSYYFVTTPAKATWPNIIAVKNWVFQELSQSDENYRIE